MDRIKKYEPLWGSWYVEKRIGKGSFGTVYKVTRKTRKKTFVSAVKLISIPASDEEINLQRKKNRSEESIKSFYDKQVEKLEQEIIFMEEMKGASNIVTIEDFMVRPHMDAAGNESVGYDVLIRMEYLTNLEDYLQEHEPDEKEVIRMGLDLCKALEHCEKNSIIHRDIKPENVFRNKFGEYKIGDFGISRQMDHTTKGTSTGTPSYMAPEIFRFEKYNQTVDIYSLGLMMYQMLNHNRLPFMPDFPEEIWPGDSQKAVQERLSGTEIPVIDGVDDELMGIVIKATAFKKEDRYQHASVMKDELNRYQVAKQSQLRTIEETVSSDVTTDEDETRLFEEVVNKTKDEDHILEKTGNTSGDKAAKIGVGALVLIIVCGCLGLMFSMKKGSGVTENNHAPESTEVVSTASTEIGESENTVDTSTETTDRVKAVSDNPEIGDLVSFGSYEQDKDTLNGKETISWRVLDKVDDKCLLISEYGLDCQAYNNVEKDTDIPVPVSPKLPGSDVKVSEEAATGEKSSTEDEENTYITWEESTLRAWLNSEFYDEAFTDEEKERINNTDVTAEDNPEYGTEAGNDTKDNIFLLSISEAETYFESDEARVCEPTEYTLSNGLTVDPETEGACCWYLRTPGAPGWNIPSSVNEDGAILTQGDPCDYGDEPFAAIRPAMWITP